MTTYSITSFGGVRTEQSLTATISEQRSPQYKWMQRLRTALDFVTADNSLICIADSAFIDSVQNVRPLGIAQNFSWNENISSALVPEIGSRRKRAIVGNSQGGSIQISNMVVMGESMLETMVKNGLNTNINPTYWGEQEWMGLVGLDHDKLKTPIGIVVVDSTPDGRNYVSYMFEQVLIQGQSRGYQAGQHLVVDNFNLIFEHVVPIQDYSREAGGGVDYVTTI